MKDTVLTQLKDKTRVCITHDFKFLPNADRVIIMDNGRIVLDGPYQKIQKTELFSEIQAYYEKNQECDIQAESGIIQANKEHKPSENSAHKKSRQEDKEINVKSGRTEIAASNSKQISIEELHVKDQTVEKTFLEDRKEGKVS